MAMPIYNPHTIKTSFQLPLNDFNLAWKKLEKSLIFGKISSSGRNNNGIITFNGRGGGHKKKIRVIDYHRNFYKGSAIVASIEYDPNRTAQIALLKYKTGLKKYIICPRFLRVGMLISSGIDVSLNIGNSLPLLSIPLGTIVNNIELTLGKGSQVARSAGTCAKIISKENHFVSLKLPSSEIRLFDEKCYATIGQVGNVEANNVKLGKAGRHRWLGRKPSVRGVAMNPVDHPHGGGEGRSPIGRIQPLTPWGKPALGVKTRNPKKISNRYIVCLHK